jgi:hypothetical protein
MDSIKQKKIIIFNKQGQEIKIIQDAFYDKENSENMLRNVFDIRNKILNVVEVYNLLDFLSDIISNIVEYPFARKRNLKQGKNIESFSKFILKEIKNYQFRIKWMNDIEQYCLLDDVYNKCQYIVKTKEIIKIGLFSKSCNMQFDIMNSGECVVNVQGKNNKVQVNSNSMQVTQNIEGTIIQFDYEKAKKVMYEIEGYFETKQFSDSFNESGERIKELVYETLQEIEYNEKPDKIISVINLIKSLVEGATGSLIASGILELLKQFK